MNIALSEPGHIDPVSKTHFSDFEQIDIYNHTLPGPIAKPVHDMAGARNFWPAQVVLATGSTNHIGNCE